MRNARRWLVVLAALGVLSWGQSQIGAWRRTVIPATGRTTPVGILLDALGDLRTFLAQRLWFETDLYHHAMEAQGIAWTQETDLLPLYRMVTLLDPRFENAYDVAAFQLVMHMNRAKEGMAFIDEGVANNPESYLLHYTRAFLLFKQKRYNEAIRDAERARALAVAALGRAEASPGHEHQENEHLDVLNAVRLIAHSFRELGDRERERQTLELWLRVHPNDPYATKRLTQIR
ncbi:MAG: hypothetical protein FJX76_06180 [Armatimonadetes bacterium]|nr:hypothetical protein [Armatimonadota bacterium]